MKYFIRLTTACGCTQTREVHTPPGPYYEVVIAPEFRLIEVDWRGSEKPVEIHRRRFHLMDERRYGNCLTFEYIEEYRP